MALPKQKPQLVVALRDDGQPACIGDRVNLRLDNGAKWFGKITEIGKAMRFRHLGFAQLLTYRVRCTDGAIRPVHARHIVYAFRTQMQRPRKGAK